MVEQQQNALDASITFRRKQLQKTMMLDLRIVLEYGLNNGLEDKCKKNENYVLVGNKCSPLPRKHRKIFRGTSHKNNIFLSF